MSRGRRPAPVHPIDWRGLEKRLRDAARRHADGTAPVAFHDLLLAISAVGFRATLNEHFAHAYPAPPERARA